MDQPVLSFEDVAAGAEGELHVKGLSFDLRAGELAMIWVQDGLGASLVSDLAQGLAAPTQGAVRFEGRDWAALPPGAAAAERGRIGRVFEARGWISNLDLDENITLAQRHHTARPEPDIRAEAAEWAVGFGLPDLPTLRPVLMKRPDLKRAQWARAFLGNPPLILLEQPTAEVYADAVSLLVKAVDRARGRGCAVLWMTADHLVPRPAAHLNATRLFELDIAELKPLKREG